LCRSKGQPPSGLINPSEFAPANAFEVFIWVAVGGRGTLVGAALGAIFVLVTIFLPRCRPATALTWWRTTFGAT
jgi:ABC-type branched-subunit amino acid transport system permease subunit